MKKEAFEKLYLESFDEAKRMFRERAAQYEEMNIWDYFTCIDNPQKAVFVPITEKYLRLKIQINSQRKIPLEKKIENIVDMQNFLGFAYAVIKGQENRRKKLKAICGEIKKDLERT